MDIQSSLKELTTYEANSIIRSQVKSSAFGIILMELAGAVTYIIDGIVTSRFLGSTALAASGMTGICFTIVAIISGVLSAGTQQLCCNEVGRGDTEHANQTFSTVLLVTLIISLCMTLFGSVFADSIASAIGASNSNQELHQYARDYITGFFLGAPGHFFVAVLIPEVQLEGKTNRITLSIVALTIVDVIGDLLNVMVFHGGLLGMGITTSFSYYVSAFILLLTFFKKDSLFKIHLLHPDFKILSSVLNIGLPRATRRIGNLIRPFIINRFILFAGGSIAMAAFTVQQNIRYLVESLGGGICGATLLLIGMFVGEKNISAMWQTCKISLQYILTIVGSVAVIYFLIAPGLVSLYLPTDSPSYRIAVVVLRCHAISLPFLGFNEFYISVVQGTGNLKLAHLTTLLDKLIYIVLISFLLMHIHRGIYSLWIAIPLSEILLSISILTALIYRNQRNPKRKFIFSLFDDVEKADIPKIEIRITDSGQVPDTLKLLNTFCQQHQFDERLSYCIQLFSEELILMIIEHGFSEKKKPTIDILLSKDEEDMILRVKDNCRPFNASEQKAMYEKVSLGNYMGIQMISKLAKDVKYVHTLNINNFIIKI